MLSYVSVVAYICTLIRTNPKTLIAPQMSKGRCTQTLRDSQPETSPAEKRVGVAGSMRATRLRRSTGGSEGKAEGPGGQRVPPSSPSMASRLLQVSSPPQTPIGMPSPLTFSPGHKQSMEAQERCFFEGFE